MKKDKLIKTDKIALRLGWGMECVSRDVMQSALTKVFILRIHRMTGMLELSFETEAERDSVWEQVLDYLESEMAE